LTLEDKISTLFS